MDPTQSERVAVVIPVVGSIDVAEPFVEASWTPGEAKRYEDPRIHVASRSRPPGSAAVETETARIMTKTARRIIVPTR